MAYSEVEIDIDIIRKILQNNELPMAMALKKSKKEQAKYTCISSDFSDINQRGWKLVP